MIAGHLKNTPLFASENSNLRTPKNASISTKNGSFEPQILNGASNGINFEPEVFYIVEFLHLCLHDEATIEQIKLFLYNKDIKDY